MKSIKRILATTLMLVMVFTLVMGTFSVSAAAAVTCADNLIVVDDDFASKTKGSTVSATVAGTTYTGKLGTTAFATIGEALEAVITQGSIYVAAGVYSGPIALDKGVSLYGNMMDVNPNDPSDISKAAASRAVTGANETILQDTQIYYAPTKADEMLSSNYMLTLNGFALAGDSCINLQNDRYTNARITISNNVFDLINENAYNNMGVSDDAFSAIQLGSEPASTFIAAAVTIQNNRIERIGYTGNGLTNANGIETYWATDVRVDGNYIANTNAIGFSVGQLQSTTFVTNNYVYNAGKTQVYNNIGGLVEISGNTFDTVGGNTANGQYAFGLYANATADNYANAWKADANSVLVFENTFKNVGNAIFLQGRGRLNAAPSNLAPLGSEIYDNIFIPAIASDCNFITMQYSDASYSPKVYNNYTGGLNPKDISQVLFSNAGSAFDFGSYWLNEEMTESSDLLAVKAITNTAGISFAGATIASAPDCTISVALPAPLTEIQLGLEVVEGGYYELFTDAKCTQPMVNNTLAVDTGVNYAYAKVYYGEYSIIYTLILTKKVAYSDYLDASEFVVSSEFAQYTTGQTVYVQINDEWRRAIVGHSAFADLGLALNTAQSGDTINLTAGLYEGALTFNKGVMIKGPKAGINPNNMNDFSRSDARNNLDEEAVFNTGMVFAPGINGIGFDGVTFTGNAMFTFSTTFNVDGMLFTNMLFTGTTGTDSLLYRGRNDAGRNTMSNAVISFNRFEGAGSSYVMRYSNISNGLFDSNVFYNSTKSIYIGGVDGSASDVLTFKDNIFYGFTSNIALGDSSNVGAKVTASVKFDGNRFIDCTAASILYLRRWRSGCTFTAVNNSFEGSTKGAFYVSPEPGFSGQNIVMHENYFGDNVTSALNHSLDSVADASHNYYAKGPSTVFAGDAKYVPYYTDAAMTILAGDYQVLNVDAPAGAILDVEKKTINYTANTAADELSFKLNVSLGATYELYADEKCTELCKNDTVALIGEKTTAYAKVIAEDGATSTVYTINITQPKNNKAELKGLAIDGCTLMNQGANTYSAILPSSYVAGPLVPVTSAGATVSVYAGTDVEMKTPINYNTDIAYPVGKSTYIIKVTSEDGTVSEVYTVSLSRSKSTACDLVGINGGLEEAVINGNTAIVTYGYETEKITPEIVVSSGAKVTLYKYTGGNVPLTEKIALNVGENKVFAVVTAEDGETQKEYIIIMVRKDQSAEKEILSESFPTYATSKTELEADTEGKLVGLKYLSNEGHLYLVPNAFIESIDDALVVSEGATYEIFKDYDYVNDQPIGAAISSNADQKTLKLTEGDNIFHIRISAKNGTKSIYKLIIQNEVKETGCEIIDVNGFSVNRDGNVINASSSVEVTQIDFFLSTNAAAKVYADRKKTIEVDTTMTTYTVTDTQEVYSDCRLNNVPTQAFVKYYVDVTSQSGETKSYIINLTQGARNAVFADIVEHWAENYINDAYAMGITNGVANPDGSLTFNPNSYATRQEVAIFICNLMGIDAASYAKGSLPYKDAKSIASWAKNAVRAVTALGIFTGDGTNFNPKANISRQEFMIVIVRACALDTSKGKASAIASFKDKDQIAKWAKVYVQTAVSYGLVNGDTSGKINPTAPITRAEIAKIMVCAKGYAR